EIYFTFITEAGWYASTIGYYYYPTGQEPASPNNVEKFLIVPNNSIAGNHSNSFGKDPGNDAPMQTNTKIQLLFRNADGKLTSKFPPGYTIGYFLIPDAYKNATNNTTTTKRVDGTKDPYKITSSFGSYYYMSGGTKVYVKKFYKNATAKTGEASSSTFKSTTYKYFDIVETSTSGGTNGIDYTKNWVYSNKKWNSDGKDHYIALTDSKTGQVVYALEDGGDKSYEDVLFTISCSPEQAIYNPERPVIEKDGSTKTTSSTKTHGYYCYEDIWSSGGDYDMNDVIVEYTYSEDIVKVVNYKTTTSTMTGSSTTTETSSRTYLDKVTVSIMPKHCGGIYQDGFSIQFPETFSTFKDRIKSITVNGTPLNKDEQQYWRPLSRYNSDLYGNIINVADYPARLNYMFFDDIRQQKEGKGYNMVIQFNDEEGKCVTKSEWESNRYSSKTDAKEALNENRLRYFYNAYITVYNLSLAEGSANECEVHLPLYPFTENGIPNGAAGGQDNQSWNLWFVSASKAGVTGSAATGGPYYPFAMDIPYYEGFYPSRETTKISDAYPRFLEWQIDGSDKSDWYKYRAKNKTQPFSLDFLKSIRDEHTNVINDYDN
ncbi:MAG: LruC domain-containing protein, partial [Bacteroidaceae bacterium]|nr:LruC domain-containing protein [Bacteroidaceae bacterium]